MIPRAPTVVIVGRPNVGKSTLFNRLVGRKLALVDDTPGVTRDRREGDGMLYDLNFKIVDTAGFEDADAATLAGRMRAQTDAALGASDVALLVFDPSKFAFNARTKNCGLYGRTRWVELPRDEQAFDTLLKTVATLVAHPEPPRSEKTCDVCALRFSAPATSSPVRAAV